MADNTNCNVKLICDASATNTYNSSIKLVNNAITYIFLSLEYIVLKDS